MTPFDANRLAIRYKNIWHGGPALDELRTQFEHWDHEHLVVTITRLALTHDHAPTLAHINRAYDELGTGTSYGWQRPDDTGPPISLDDYLTRHPDDTALATTRARHPSSQRPTPHATHARSFTD